MAGLGSGVDSLRPFMDGDPVFDPYLVRASIGADAGVCDGA